jgi:hypothetical protein
MNSGKISMATLRLACIVFLAAFAGCVKEDVEHCFVTRTVVVKAYDNDGAELGPTDVHEVTLYLFDGDGRFLETLPARIGRPVEVKIPAGCDIDMVAWGNLKSGLQDVREDGLRKEDYSVNLMALSSNGSGHASPDDLYYGGIVLTEEEYGAPATRLEEEIIIPMHCVVGSVTITLRNLEELADHERDGLRVVVRETVSSIDFYGVASGGPAAYHPEGSLVDDGGGMAFFVPLFNVIPGPGLVIDIYGGDELLFSVNRDADGNPIVPEQGLSTNVLINNYGRQDAIWLLEVSVVLTPWGMYQLWKDF